MDSFNQGNLLAEKANLILKYFKLRKIAGLFRFVEVCVVLVLISRLSIRLPVAVKSSSDYFRNLSVFVISPRFVFVVGNVIIITLFAQSRQFSAKVSPSKSSESDLYEEFIKKITKYQKIGEQMKYPEKHANTTEDRTKNQTAEGEKTNYPVKQSIRIDPESTRNQGIDEYQIKYSEKKSIRTGHSIKNQSIDGPEKQCIRTEHRIRNQRTDGYPEKHSIIRREYSIKNQRVGGYQITSPEDQSKNPENENICKDLKAYRRSLTEKFSPVKIDKQHRVLQRSETEKICKSIEAAEKFAWTSNPVDNMSNDDFRRTVDAFIARQRRLQREEELYIV